MNNQKLMQSSLMEGTEILGAFAVSPVFSINFAIYWPTTALRIHNFKFTLEKK